MKSKTPFLIYKEFLSPLMCESFVDELDLSLPDVDKDKKPMRSGRMLKEDSENLIMTRISPIISKLNDYYEGFLYKGTERPMLEWYPQGTMFGYQCENSNYVRKKWLRTKPNDLTAVVFMMDFHEKVPFDTDFEVYGGKLEFPQHQFSFNPERGTMIIFPSGPHFINGISEILYGNSILLRIHMVSEFPYHYDPELFPGDYRVWFKDLMD